MTATTEAPKQPVAVAQRQRILAAVEHYAEQIDRLAPRGADSAYYVASLRLYLAQNPTLLECEPGSIVQGMLRVAQTGLTVGVSCDLLPFGKVCQFSPRYSGIIELSLMSGTRSINADVVRDGDLFEWEKGTQFVLRHRKIAKATTPITHAYAIAEVKQGSFVFEVAEKDEINEIRRRFSKSWYWRDKSKSAVVPLEEIPWYAKKTMVRKLSPFLPKNPRLAAALQYEDALDQIPDAEFEIEGDREEPAEGAPAEPRQIDGEEVPNYQDDRDLL